MPAVANIGGVAIAQPRGTAFVEAVSQTNGVYEVDTVLASGSVETTRYQVEACGSLSDEADRRAFMGLPARLPKLAIIGLGITEAGFTADK